ncbi:MAG: Tat pathway signal protein, partial [Myxococcales bacterium]|nr:Tat pathway signal protein [Myxococcales bacterium]
GKDHWPITSMFALGPGIAGNRMIGGTDNDQLARRVDPDSLELSDDGIKLGPEHVHRALRAIAGMDDAPFMGEYPLPGEDLALFG